MHPDRKIGIAMGILLIGVVGALFFRNEPLEQEDHLTVRRENELNETLQDRDVSLYLEDGEKPPANDRVNVQARLEEILAQKRESNAVSRDLFRQDFPADLSPREPDSDGGFAPLDFEPPVSANDPATTDAVDDKPAGQNVFSEVVKSTPPAVPRQDAAQYDEYTVKFGDSLSAIAKRFLGSHNRYNEIYEANKDRLASPDDLRVGKAIRIPRVIR